MSIEEDIRQDWEYLSLAKLHEITARVYLYAALMGSGDSFHVSLTDSVAPVAARKFVGSKLSVLLKEHVATLPVVSEIKFITDDLAEVVLR